MNSRLGITLGQKKYLLKTSAETKQRRLHRDWITSIKNTVVVA